MIDRSQITGLVLCGGGGRRMGGVDKPLVNLNGQPIVAWVVERVRPQVGQILICCNRHRERYESYALTCVDEIPGQLGPLAGIHAGLRHCTTDYALVCPGDTPLLSPHLAKALGQAMEEQGRVAAMAHDGTRPQPLFVLLERESAPSIEAYMEHANRKALGWVESMKPAMVDFSEEAESFTNVNTRSDLQRLERWFRLRGLGV